MDTIDDLDTLLAVYPEEPARGALDKVVNRITPAYARWLAASRFCILSTVGPEGTDASPRGDDGPVAEVLDPTALALPDWRGNNRIDSLRNIVRDGRIAVLFMVRGTQNVVRVNGTARLTADAAMTARFERDGRQPRSVIVVSVKEVYFQCAKAVMRAALWDGTDDSGKVPTAGAFKRELDAAFDADAYDAEYGRHAARILW